MIISILAIPTAIALMILLIWWIGPADANTWQDAVATSLAKRSTSEAQILKIIEDYPSSPAGLAAWTEKAVQDGNWSQVVQRAAAFRDKFPGDIYGYLAGGRGLLETGDTASAERLLQNAIRRFRTEPRPMIDYAIIAHHQRNWPEAQRRWRQVAKRFPHEPDGFVWEGMALVEIEQFDAADALLLVTCERFPDVKLAALWYAESATRQGRWAEAASRWELLRNRFDMLPEGYVRGSEALRRAGQDLEAKKVISDGLYIFPNHNSVKLQWDIVNCSQELR